LNLDDVPTQDLQEKTDVLLVEVIEHMPLADAEKLIRAVFERVNFNRIFITTPNKEFNQFFSDDEEHMRHDDHHWEMDRGDFYKWFLGLGVLPDDCVAIAHDVGDQVNGIAMTTGLVIERKQKAAEASA
jgi:hypothetical protein